MEVKEEKAMDQGGESKIPVFTVLKNGAILKNIFVVNSPDSLSPENNGGGDDREVEEILVVGRHPDCNIMLTHPSISRFHLQIHSIPSLQKLSVTDLSSVHGTWISDQKIEPGTCVEVKEGDTIRIGGSTRIYRLHWIPLRCAYDMDNPFVSPLDMYAAKEQDKENEMLKAENIGGTHEDGKLVPGEGEALQLDWTSGGTGSSIPSEDPDSIVKETSSLPLASPRKLPLAEDSSEMRKQQLCEDAQASPKFITDIVEVEAENPRTGCLAGKLQNGGCPGALSSSLFAEIAEDAENESLHQEDNGETEAVSRQVMEASSSFFAKTEPLLEIKAKDIQGPVLGQQLLSEIQSELVNEVDNQILHQEDSGESEVVSRQVMAVSAQLFTATEPLLETKTNVIQGPLLGWQQLSEIQSELAQQADNQSLHQEDDGEIDVVSRQIMTTVSSCSFPETEPLLKTKNEDIQGPSLAWQPLSEIQSELPEQADDKSLHQQDNGEADVVSRQVMAASSCSFPETESPLETKSKNIQDPFLGWQPLSQIQSEVKPARDQNQNSGMSGETEEPFGEANNLSLSKGGGQSEPWSSLSAATNQNPNVEQHESVIDIGSGGGSEEASSLSELEGHLNNEKMGFITATLAAEEPANLLQPAEDIFFDVTGGKENQTLRSHAVGGVLSETENLRSFPLESAKRSCNIWSKRGKSASVLQIRNRSEGNAKRIGDNCKAHWQRKGVINDKSIQPSLHAGSEKLEPEIFTPDKEKLTPNTHILKRLQEIGDIKENKSSSLHAGSEKLESEIFSPDKENLTPNAHILKRLQEIDDIKESKSSIKVKSRPFSLKIPSSNDITASVAVLEPEIFTPDKENLTPNSLMLKRLQEVGKLKGNKDSSKATRKPFSSKVVFSPDIHSEENIVPVEKENQSSFCSTSSQSELKHEQLLPKRKTERVPFQSLLDKSSAKSKWHAETSNAAARNDNSRGSRPSSILSNGKSKLKWTIVVDTSSLLDRESRKSLQLLQGLKGTQLVIPRTVLRELHERKRSCRLFFSRTTDVSSAHEWIQECMVKTKWWVHLQSSYEETGPTALTPPAPLSLFSDGSAFPFSLHQAAPGIISPTSEDNVLECALLYRKRNSNGQLVLLSNDVTLKIKAMAEGIMCETAQEFQESVANPYSERFMWGESTARGRTWRHVDDVVLRERYKSSSSSAKGLKLILLHNSHYGHTKSN